MLALVLLEMLLLYIRYRRSRGVAPRRWLSPAVAGAALALALLFAQIGAGYQALGAALTVAGIAHVLGYRQRWVAGQE